MLFKPLARHMLDMQKNCLRRAYSCQVFHYRKVASLSLGGVFSLVLRAFSFTLSSFKKCIRPPFMMGSVDSSQLHYVADKNLNNLSEE
jgi:hypothetical protein